MGLRSDTGLEAVKPNVIQRGLQRLGGTRLGTAVFSKILSPVDRATYRITGGRTCAGRVFGALPVAVLTTTGARSGRQRMTHINVIPIADDLALVGTNFGSRTPAWAHNLYANAAASLTYKNQVYEVVAREADDGEYEEVFATAIGIFHGYARYRRNATHEIPVFILSAKGPK